MPFIEIIYRVTSKLAQPSYQASWEQFLYSRLQPNFFPYPLGPAWFEKVLAVISWYGLKVDSLKFVPRIFFTGISFTNPREPEGYFEEIFP